MSRELIRNIYNSFYKLRDRAERIASRAIDNAADLLIFGKELRQVAFLGVCGGARWGESSDGGGLRADRVSCANCHSDLFHYRREESRLGKWGGVMFRRTKVGASARAALNAPVYAECSPVS